MFYYFEYLLDVNSYVVVLVLSLTIGITFFLFGKSKKDEIGIYEHIDYAKQPEDYCGIKITDTPLVLDNSKKNKPKSNNKSNNKSNKSKNN